MPMHMAMGSMYDFKNLVIVGVVDGRDMCLQSYKKSAVYKSDRFACEQNGRLFLSCFLIELEYNVRMLQLLRRLPNLIRCRKLLLRGFSLRNVARKGVRRCPERVHFPSETDV